jgi:hypothetical protein
MIKIFAVAASVVAAPAFSDVATIENCRVTTYQGSVFAKCEVTNNSQATIASITLDGDIYTDGRDVAWVRSKANPLKVFYSAIPGGIEPGEKLDVIVVADSISARASSFDLQLKIFTAIFFDADGEAISTP